MDGITGTRTLVSFTELRIATTVPHLRIIVVIELKTKSTTTIFEHSR